jgi:subfamily B ATP-binding cassette protein MsbA
MILDEATSALDNIAERTVQKAINDISKHTTVIVVAHRLSTIQNADKIVVLEKGRVMEQGGHQELFEKRSAYYRLYTTLEGQNEHNGIQK